MAGSFPVVGNLLILSQGSVMHENFSKNGVQKQVHVVVKNLVFMVEIEAPIDLTKSTIEAKLLYDFDTDRSQKVEVSFVKNEPLDYKINIGESGQKATVELRIKVLTSQHEDMLFRVRIAAIIDGQAYECHTQPIKVISKMTQKREPMAPAVVTPTPVKKRSSSSVSSVSSTEVITATLLRLEQQQQEIQKMLQLLIHRLFMDSTYPTSPQANMNVPAISLHALSNLVSQQQIQQAQSEQVLEQGASNDVNGYGTTTTTTLSASTEDASSVGASTNQQEEDQKMAEVLLTQYKKRKVAEQQQLSNSQGEVLQQQQLDQQVQQ